MILTEGGGGIRFADSFWKILYAKSLFFIAFVICAILVYKICRELDINENKSRWASFIYFTSSMAVNSVCLVGNCDSLGAALTLTGLLAYIRNRNSECFFWFVLAFPFKQQSAFIFLPLMLIRDKNFFRTGLKLLAMVIFVALTDIPLRNTPEAMAIKNSFFGGMLLRMSAHKLPFLSSQIAIFPLLYGLLCAWCWLTPEPEAMNDKNTMTLFVSMLSITIALSSVASHPQWFLQLASYMAVAVVYYGRVMKELFLFETVGSLALLGYNFIHYNWVYTPDNAAPMLLYKLAGSPSVRTYSELKSAVLNVSSASQNIGISRIRRLLGGLRSGCGTLYVVCMIVIIFWLCRPQNVDTKIEAGIRPLALGRMFVNMAACCIPLIYFLISAL